MALIVYEGDGREYRTGEDCLNELVDVIRDLIPDMRYGDPVRWRFTDLAQQLTRELGRPAVKPVRTREEG